MKTPYTEDWNDNRTMEWYAGKKVRYVKNIRRRYTKFVLTFNSIWIRLSWKLKTSMKPQAYAIHIKDIFVVENELKQEM